MNNKSNIKSAIDSLHDMAENHNIMLSTVEQLIEITNSEPSNNYDEKIRLLDKLQSILGGTV